MRNTIRFAFALLISILLLTSFSGSNNGLWNENSPVYEILFHLGEAKPDHYREFYTDEMISDGRDIVFNGKMKGKSFVSKYYVCVSCHNTVREDSDLKIVDPESRLQYAAAHNIPYLQSSTFWAMVNRESWYNDDYVKKYGDLVVKANKSLVESMQLCATVCSQGRRLDEIEVNALLAYFRSLELKLSDLDLTEGEKEKIKTSASDTTDSKNLIRLIKSKYQLKSPATFSEGPPDKKNGYGLQGRPEMGALVYNLSCKHCHRPNGESDVIFDDSKTTFRWLKKNMYGNSQLSIYQITRYGTYPEAGHPEYMPHFTLEKMSNQQVEDLRAYIELKADK